MLRHTVLVAVVAGCLTMSSSGASMAYRQEPSVDVLLEIGGRYVAEYAPKVSGVTLEELFLLSEIRGSRAGTPTRISSDLVVVDSDGRVLGLRDPYAIDTRPLRDRQPRITMALAEPSMANWQIVQSYAREHAVYFMANVVLWYNDPMLALQFISKQHRGRIVYAMEGDKRINGVQTYGLGFKERDEPGVTSLLNTPGNPLASGRFWIDPATGAIHRTELWIQSVTDTARILVTYAPDRALDLLLPKEASHTFEWREKGTGLSSIGAGGSPSRQAFEGSATYSNPRYSPINLNRIIR